MCGQIVEAYICPCGAFVPKLMPPSCCDCDCLFEKRPISITLQRPCEDCYEMQLEIFAKLHGSIADQSNSQQGDGATRCIRGPGPNEGSPPTYKQATETPPSYTQAVAEEQPATYDDIMSATANFDPEQIVNDWHEFRASQLLALPPLSEQLVLLQQRISKARRHLHKLEDIGFCEEVRIRLAREQANINIRLDWGRRYLDAALVLNYGLNKCQTAASKAIWAGRHDEAKFQAGLAAEHADRLLEMEIQLSRHGQNPEQVASKVRPQIRALDRVVLGLEARMTSRVWVLLQVATRSGLNVQC